MLCGDFNHLNITPLTSQFKLKQLMDKATRGNWILDLAITNLAHLYDKNSVDILPPFGLMDHSVVIVCHKACASGGKGSRKVVLRCDTWVSRKNELGGYLGSIDWSVVVVMKSPSRRSA